MRIKTPGEFQFVRAMAARAIAASVLILFGGSGSVSLAAQADDAPIGALSEKPLLTVNVASFDRLLDGIDYLFQSADHAEMLLLSRGLLASVNNLRGLDRKKPFGVMVFIQHGRPPQPVPIGYVPVTDVADLRAVVRIGASSLVRVKRERDRYQLTTPYGTLQLKLQNGYAFIATDAALLKHRFPDPVKLTKQMSSKYDIALSIAVEDIPAEMSNLVLDFLRAAVANELQQRDGESIGDFRIRKLSSLGLLGILEQVAEAGRELTLGWNVSRKTRRAVFEIALTAVNDGRLSRFLKRAGGAKRRFSPLISAKSVLSTEGSWQMGGIEQAIVLEAVKQLEERLPVQKREDASVKELFSALKQTIDAGHAHAAIQVLRGSSGKLAIVTGFKVADDVKTAESVAELLTQLQNDPDFSEIELNAASHHGISIHRLRERRLDELRTKLFAENAATYLAVGRGVFWIAFGGEDAVSALKKAMDQTADALPAGKTTHTNTVFHLAAGTSLWLKLLPDLLPSGAIAPLLRTAFSKGGDSLDVRITADAGGVLFRLELGEAFIRLAGMAAANAIAP